MQITLDRRALHQIPELDRDLPKTMAYLKSSLESLRCKVFSPMPSALCAWFDFGAEEAIAFRSDADALPITERSCKDYASRHPGRMHACGHDGHMAILLELARRLDKKENLRYNVLLVFQPAEETTGGAKDICKTGIFKKYKVEAIFGIHLWPGLEAGMVASRRNEMMSRSCEVKVDIYGKSAHIAKAEEGIDAMAAGVEFYRRCMIMESAMPKKVFRLLKFGKFQSGSVRNALSDHTHMEGSLRAFQDDIFYSLRAGLVSIGKDIERQSGCTVNIYMNDGYPAIIKPYNLGSSVGIHKCRDRASLLEGLEDAFLYSQAVLAERAVQNLREINCAVLGDYETARPSACEEPLNAEDILTFGDKYLSGNGGKSGGSKGMTDLKRRCPADLPDGMTERVQELSVATFKALGCLGVARIDFLNDKQTGELWVNEINTIPGSLSFYLWQEVGVSFGQLMDELVSLDRLQRAMRIYARAMLALNEMEW